jgi:KDO2-lipid IV(A) lauroyltransferase
LAIRQSLDTVKQQKTSPTKSILRIALQPRNWPLAIGFVLLRVVITLPFPMLLRIGKGIGRLMYLFARQRRRITEINIGLCFPELSQHERNQLTRKTFESIGIAVLETPLAWWADWSRLKSLAHFNGYEHIIRAKEEGHSILLLGAHFTDLEIGGTLMATRQPTVNMYKRHRNPLFEAVMRKNRERQLAGLIQRHDVRSFVRTLNAGKVCWIAPDQDFGRRSSVIVPFLGVPAATTTATARIAKMSNAVVIPFFPIRRRDASGYDLIILPPMQNFPSGDDEKDAAYINKVIGDQVKLAPDQYLWLHRRFKTRPEGEPPLYPPKRKRK